MSKRPSFETFKKIAMRDKEFKTAYELLRPEFELIENSLKKKKARQAILQKTLKSKKIKEIK